MTTKQNLTFIPQTIASPNLPTPTQEYKFSNQNDLTKVLRLFFEQVTNAVNYSLSFVSISPSYTIFPYNSSGMTYQQDSFNRINASGNVIIGLPYGTRDGGQISVWVCNISSGNITVTLASSIVIPASCSFFSNGVTIASGKKARLLLQYDAIHNGGQWEIVNFINGY
jgi:hypothetical protein